MDLRRQSNAASLVTLMIVSACAVNVSTVADSNTDCNNNGVLDVNELGINGWGFDDGVAEGPYYILNDTALIAVQFDAGDGTIIRGIAAAITDEWSSIELKHPVRLFVWDDPNNDGNPSDVRLQSQSIQTIEVLGSQLEPRFNKWHIDPTAVSGSFFVGVAYEEPAADDFFHAIILGDATTPLATTRAWFAIGIDATALRAGHPYAQGLIRPFIHVLVSDCDANNIPDACELSDGTLTDANADHVPDECVCFADLLSDALVNEADLNALLAAWGSCPNTNCPADFDSNGNVDIFDLLLLLGAWGACP